MKNPRPAKTIISYCIPFIVLITILCSCRKTPLFEGPETKSASLSNSFTRYTIAKSAHYSNGNSIKTISKTALHFIAKFDSTCKYQTSLQENRADINKLYGFSDCGAQHHISSARFGWVSTGDSIELHAYVYLNGERKSKYLHTVATNTEVELTITPAANSYLFIVNGKISEMPRQCNSEKIEGYQLYPYFGGDETAPHEMHIFIKEL